MSIDRNLTRRTFLKRTAAGTAALTAGLSAVSAPAQDAPKPKWEMKLSASTICFTKLPIEKTVEQIASIGFDGIDIWSAHAGCPHLDDALDRLGPDGVKKLLAAADLDLYSFSVYKGGYRQYAELLGGCGGGVAVRGSSRPVPSDQLTTSMKAFIESLKPDLELCEKYDSYLAIENHGHALLDSADSFKAFVDINTNPRLGIALAPYHLQRVGEDVADVIRSCGDQLLYFYAWQHAPGTAQLPGVGPVDFKPWLAALADIDYKWYVNPFMHHEPEPEVMAKELARSREYLLKCYAAVVGS